MNICFLSLAAGVCCLQECRTDTFAHAHFVSPRPNGWPSHCCHDALLPGTGANGVAGDSCSKWVSAGRRHVDGFQESHSPVPALSSSADFPRFHSQSAEKLNKRFLWKVVFVDGGVEAAVSWQRRKRRRRELWAEGSLCRMLEGRSSFGGGASSGSLQIGVKGQRSEDKAWTNKSDNYGPISRSNSTSYESKTQIGPV